MSDETEAEGLLERLTRQSEDALGKLAEDLLENPLVSAAVARGFEARDKASAAQEAALGALNIPTSADIERLTRRVRSVSQRLEAIEDGIDRLDDRFSRLAGGAGIDARLDGVEQQLTALARELAALREALPGGAEPVPSGQERLTVPG